MGLLINGEYVDDTVIREEMASLRPHYEAMMADMEPVAREVQLKDWSKENVIERVLLRQEAAKLPAAGPEETDEERMQRLILQVSERTPKPKKQELLDFYKANEERFVTPPMLNASHIVKNVNDAVDEATARAAIEVAEAELKAGATFAEVADRHSDCAGGGGSLGWFPLGEMVEDFEATVMQMKPGEVSPIFRSVFGFHIAMLHDQRGPGTQPFNDVREELENHLMTERRERSLEVYVDGLKETAQIKSAKQP